eukprot:GILI01023467.1.p1 GENE.GILI01023467.1~~GILI01023467.1.p1  ORF type:complete len:170 (+),score=24.70 GILI01023467.1:48-512(+)
MGAGYHSSAGAMMSLAWFFFFDGFQIAKNENASEYTFVTWLPGLLAMLGFILIAFVVPEHIIGSDSDDGMFLTSNTADDGEVMRSKFLFMIGYFMVFAGLSVGIWKLIDPYTKPDSPTAFPGVALLIQVVCIAASSTLCLLGRKKVEDDGLMFS